MSHTPDSTFSKWLKKYRYVNIALIYLGTALVVIHFAEAVVHGLHMPDITFSLIVVLALAGLPIVLLIAWATGHKKEETTDEVSAPKQVRRNGMKIIAASVLSIALFTTAIFVYNKFFYHSKFTGKEKSIAVLPFANMGSDKENEYFSDGISSEITNQLTKIGSIDVRAWSSSAHFKNSNKSLKEIAEVLNTEAILAGQCQRNGNKIRIHAELTDVNTNNQIWGKDYDREWGDIFVIQSELAQQIAYELNAELTKDEKKKIEKKPTNNAEAYKYYLQGRQLHSLFWENHNVEYFENSRTLFEKALMLDSNYALAHAALADLYNTYSKEDSLIVSRQVTEIEKAWRIDSTLEYVIFVKGTIEQSPLENKASAFEYFKKGLRANPNEPDNLWGMGMLLAVDFGMVDEAKILFEKIIKLDPLTANQYGIIGICHFYLGNYEEAVKNLEIAIRLNPEYVGALDGLAQVYASRGRLDDAKKLIEKSFLSRPALTDHWENYIGYVYAKMGNRNKALELSPGDWWTLLALGMKEEALKAMPFYDETEKKLNTPYLILKSQFETKDFDPIRHDERFLKIMERNRVQYEENKKKFNIAGILN
jgi:TolB-like protein